MINELIEKEIEKLFGNFDGEPRIIKDLNRDDVTESLQTIAKEVAMRFKEENWNPQDDYDRGYTLRVTENNNLADQIINEVSK